MYLRQRINNSQCWRNLDTEEYTVDGRTRLNKYMTSSLTSSQEIWVRDTKAVIFLVRSESKKGVWEEDSSWPEARPLPFRRKVLWGIKKETGGQVISSSRPHLHVNALGIGLGGRAVIHGGLQQEVSRRRLLKSTSPDPKRIPEKLILWSTMFSVS